jgi:pilus assembly protein Flp/PilA
MSTLGLIRTAAASRWADRDRTASRPDVSPLWRWLMSIADHRLVRSEDGVTAIEYGLIAALVAVVIVTAITLVGTNISAVFDKVSAKL